MSSNHGVSHFISQMEVGHLTRIDLDLMVQKIGRNEVLQVMLHFSCRDVTMAECCEDGNCARAVSVCGKVEKSCV